MVINSEDAKTYFFTVGKERLDLFLSPGDSVYGVADSKDFKVTLIFEGDPEAENTYLFDLASFSSESGINNVMELMKLNKEDYFQKKNGFFDKQNERFIMLLTSGPTNGR